VVAAEVPDRSQPWPAAFRLFVLLSSHFSDSTHDADDELTGRWTWMVAGAHGSIRWVTFPVRPAAGAFPDR
jgi:hypothetical protein